MQNAREDPLGRKADRQRLHRIRNEHAAAVIKTEKESAAERTLDAGTSECHADPDHREREGNDKLTNQEAGKVTLHFFRRTPEPANVLRIGAMKPDFMDEIIGRADGNERDDNGNENANGINGSEASSQKPIRKREERPALEFNARLMG